MSPEQAMGDRELDARSDIYSVGAMLYEMLTGDPPYMGSTAQAIVAKVITEHAPSVSATRDTVPPNVAASVDKALAKLPADRFTSAAHFAEALVTPGFTGLTTQAAVPGAAASPPSRRTTVALGGATALMTLLFLGSLLLRNGPVSPEVTRQRIVLSTADGELGKIGFQTAIAPDGSAIVFQDTVGGTAQLWLKQRGQATANLLAGTDGGNNPFFSPDGEWIAFFADGKLRKVPKGGGSAITLSDSAVAGSPNGAWLDDGTIVFNHRWNLVRVSESGGEAEQLLQSRDTLGFDRIVVKPSPIPGSRGVFFTGCDATCSTTEVYVYDMEAGEVRKLVEEAGLAWYVPSGHLIYVRRDGGVFAAPFDHEALTMSGAAVPVLGELRTSQFGFADATLAANGTLLYVTGDNLDDQEAEVVWVDRAGRAEPVDSGWTVRS
jgi:serine/threonine-protein kinase